MCTIFEESSGYPRRISRNDRAFTRKVHTGRWHARPSTGSLLLEVAITSRTRPTPLTKRVKAGVGHFAGVHLMTKLTSRNHVLLELRFRQGPTGARFVHSPRLVFIPSSPIYQTRLTAPLQHPRRIGSNAWDHSTTWSTVPNWRDRR